MEKFKVIIVEDVKLELKGTEEIFRHEIPNAEVIGTAMTEAEFWNLLETKSPDMVLLDLGLGGSTTIGVDICSRLHKQKPEIKILIFTGEVLNEKLWVDALNAGADGIILKTGELLTAVDVQAVMEGKKLVFNYPILEKIVARFKQSVAAEQRRQEAIIDYDIDEYDERLLRHLALGAGGGLMDHDLRVGQGDALALGAGAQQERAHTGSHADADGGHVALDILHGVIDGHAVRHGAAGAVDIQLDVLVGVLGLQIQQLGHHQGRGGGVDLLAQKDDPVIQQPGEDVIGPLAAVGLLDDIGD